MSGDKNFGVDDLTAELKKNAETIKEGASTLLNGLKEAVDKVGAATQGEARKYHQPAEQNQAQDLRIVLKITGRRVRVIGDEQVRTVKVSGAGVISQEADKIEVLIEGDLGPRLEQLSPTKLFARGVFKGINLKETAMGKEVVVRVNPKLAVAVEATMASVSIDKLTHLAALRISGGKAAIGQVDRLDEALVQTGNLSIKSAPAGEKSRIRVESGTLFLSLDQESNVKVSAKTKLGKILWPKNAAPNIDQYVLGAGATQINIEVLLGLAQISLTSQED